MTWIRRAPIPPPPHKCELPRQAGFMGIITKPDGQHGDLWRCDDCGLLWTIRDAFNTNGPEWRRAGWLARWRYRNPVSTSENGES